MLCGVTVLQHILDPELLRAAVQAWLRGWRRGRMILLSALQRPWIGAIRRCPGAAAGCLPGAFPGLWPAAEGPDRSRSGALADAPAAHLRRLPRTVAMSLLMLTTALSLPIDALLGRRAVKQSWTGVCPRTKNWG